MAAAYGFMSKFLVDYKKDLHIISEYEKSFYEFILTETDLNELFEPFFNHLYHADKDDFTLNNCPLIFCLKYFNEHFYLSQKISKK